MDRLTDKEKAIVLHTLGLSYGGLKSYRNHFVAGPGHYDLPILESLVTKGAMFRGYKPGFLDKDSFVFYVSEEWVDIAESYVRQKKAEEDAKLTRSQKRYRQYLESDGVFNSFRDFLRYESKQARQ